MVGVVILVESALPQGRTGMGLLREADEMRAFVASLSVLGMIAACVACVLGEIFWIYRIIEAKTALRQLGYFSITMLWVFSMAGIVVLICVKEFGI